MKKTRHRRTGSHGSGNAQYLQGSSSKISPLRDRKVRLLIKAYPGEFQLKIDLSKLFQISSRLEVDLSETPSHPCHTSSGMEIDESKSTGTTPRSSTRTTRRFSLARDVVDNSNGRQVGLSSSCQNQSFTPNKANVPQYFVQITTDSTSSDNEDCFAACRSSLDYLAILDSQVAEVLHRGRDGQFVRQSKGSAKRSPGSAHRIKEALKSSTDNTIINSR